MKEHWISTIFLLSSRAAGSAVAQLTLAAVMGFMLQTQLI